MSFEKQAETDNPVIWSALKLALALSFGVTWIVIYPLLGSAIGPGKTVADEGIGAGALFQFAATIVLVAAFVWAAPRLDRTDPDRRAVFWFEKVEYLGLGLGIGLVGLFRDGTDVSTNAFFQYAELKLALVSAVVPLILVTEYLVREYLQLALSRIIGWRVAIGVGFAVYAACAALLGVTDFSGLFLVCCLSVLLATLYQGMSNWITTAFVTCSWLITLIAFSDIQHAHSATGWPGVVQSLGVAVSGGDALLPSLIALLFAVILITRLARSYEADAREA